MDPGKLRHRIWLQKPVETQSPTTGEITVEWENVRQVWAAIEPLSAREFIQSAATQARIDARLTVWFESDIVATWRAVHGSTIYTIRGVLPDKDSGIEYLTLPCESGVSDGQ